MTPLFCVLMQHISGTRLLMWSRLLVSYDSLIMISLWISNCYWIMCYVMVDQVAEMPKNQWRKMCNEMPKKSVRKDVQWNAKAHTKNWIDQKEVSSILSAINSDEVFSQGISLHVNLIFQFHNCSHVQDVNYFTLALSTKCICDVCRPTNQSNFSDLTETQVYLLASWVAALKVVVKRGICCQSHN